MFLLHATCRSLSMPLSNTIKIFQTIKKLWHTQKFGLEIYSGEITKRTLKQELSFLHAIHLLDLIYLIYVPTKYYQNISNSMGVTACTRFGFSAHNYIMKKVKVISLSKQHAYWSVSMILLHIINNTSNHYIVMVHTRIWLRYSIRGDN